MNSSVISMLLSHVMSIVMQLSLHMNMISPSDCFVIANTYCIEISNLSIKIVYIDMEILKGFFR